MKKATTIILLIITFFVIATFLLAAGASDWLIAMVGLIIYFAYSSMKEKKDPENEEKILTKPEQ